MELSSKTKLDYFHLWQGYVNSADPINRFSAGIPDYLFTNTLIFANVVKQRVMELSDKPNIILLWSGGIDSTLVYYAFKKYGIPIKVAAGSKSLPEYPGLYKELVARGDLIDISKESNLVALDNATLITGEIGDQIVGSEIMLEYSEENRAKHYLTEGLLPEDLVTACSGVVVDLLGTNDITIAEYLWAINFIFKYINVTDRSKKILTYVDNTELVHFFDSVPFQQWSLQNYKSNCNFQKHTDYKKVYKDYIFTENGDEFYYKYKKKVGSLASLNEAINFKDGKWRPMDV